MYAFEKPPRSANQTSKPDLAFGEFVTGVCRVFIRALFKALFLEKKLLKFCRD